MTKVLVIRNTLSFSDVKDEKERYTCALVVQAKSLLMKKLKMWALPVNEGLLIVPNQNVNRVIAAIDQVVQRFKKTLDINAVEYCLLDLDKFVDVFALTMPKTFAEAVKELISAAVRYMYTITGKSRLRQTTLDNLSAIYVALNTFNLLNDTTQCLPIILNAKAASSVKMRAIKYIADCLSGQNTQDLDKEAFQAIIEANPPILSVEEAWKTPEAGETKNLTGSQVEDPIGVYVEGDGDEGDECEYEEEYEEECEEECEEDYVEDENEIIKESTQEFEDETAPESEDTELKIPTIESDFNLKSN